ncbi:MAG TPA: hypothetical protein VMP08_15300 [Anaerolineae bacterium]|nr:hypothetical protein [Anaerolineae bacterium]
MSLEPSTPVESAPPASAAEDLPAAVVPAGNTPAPSIAPDKPRKPRRQKFWDAAKTLTLIVSMVINLILIATVVILANQVGAIKTTLNSVLGQLDSAFEGLGAASIKDTIAISQQLPVRFDLPLNQDTVVTTQGPVPISTQATFSLGQFGSINGTVSLQLPPGTQLPVHLELTVPVSNTIPVVFNQPIDIPLAEKGLGPVVAKLRAALAPIIDLVDRLPDRFVIVPQ